jgi:hypothetical protein
VNGTVLVCCKDMVRLITIAICIALSPHLLIGRVDIAGPRVLCDGESATLSAPAGMDSYLWSTGSTSSSIVITNPGTYSIVTRDMNGVVDSGSIDITGAPKPHPTIGNPFEYLCEGDIAILDAPAHFRKYLWSTGDTTNAISVSTNGTYSLTVVDTNGCVGSSDAVRVIVVPRPNLVLKGVNSVCRDAEAVYYVDIEPGTQYQWYIDGGVILIGQGSPAVRVKWSRTGRIEVRATSQRPDGGTCDTVVALFVRVGARLRPELLYERSSFCTGDTILLRATTGYATYRWSTGETTPTIRVSAPGPYWIEVTDSSGCQGASDTLRVIEYPRPTVSIDGPRRLCGNSPVTLSGLSLANDVVLWEWNTGARTRQITVNNAGTYTVIGWTLNGCTDTAQIVVDEGVMIDATSTDLDLGVVHVGSRASGIIVIENNSDSPVTITSFTSADASLAFTPQPPTLLQPRAVHAVTVSWSPSTVGELDEQVVIALMSADCDATITSHITGISLDEDTVGLVQTTVPDTVVDVGSSLMFTIEVHTSIPFGENATARVALRWDDDVFRVDALRGATIVNDVRSGRERRAVVEFTVERDAPDRSIILDGVAMLTYPFMTPVVVDEITVNSTAPFVTVVDDGSIEMIGCWLPGRLVTFDNVGVHRRIFTLDGREITTADDRVICRPCIIVESDTWGRPLRTYLTNNISR